MNGVPEWDAVVERIVSRQRRRSRRALVGLGAFAIAAPIVTGVVIANRAEPVAAPVPSTTAPTTTTSTTVPPSTTSTSLFPVVTVARVTDGIEAEIFGQQLLDPIFVHQIDDYTIRLFKRKSGSNPWSEFGGPPVGQDGKPIQLEAQCLATNYVVQVSNEKMAVRFDLSVGGDARLRNFFGLGSISHLARAIGVEEQAPGWLAVVPVATEQKSARIGFPNGVVVDALVRDGFAVAVRADETLDWQSIGSSRAIKIDLGDGFTRVKSARNKAVAGCELPPEFGGPPIDLPKPGLQPEKPTEAFDAIDETFELFHDRSLDVEERAELVDDPDDIAKTIRQADQAFGPNGFQQQGFDGFVVQVVFTSPTTAAAETFRFGSSRVDFVLVDGAWKITRESACNLLAQFSPGCGFVFDGEERDGVFPTTAAPATTAVG